MNTDGPVIVCSVEVQGRRSGVRFVLVCVYGAQLRHLAVNVYSSFNKNNDNEGKHDFLCFTIIKSTDYSLH